MPTDLGDLLYFTEIFTIQLYKYTVLDTVLMYTYVV